MNNNLDCRTTESYMNEFLEMNLIGEELWYFLNHILNCDSCYEELETRYLLAEALSRLEEGETLDLRNELRARVMGARKALRIHRICDSIYRTIEIIAAICIAFNVGEFVSLFL